MARTSASFSRLPHLPQTYCTLFALKNRSALRSAALFGIAPRMNSKLRYFLRSAMLMASPSRRACPNCAGSGRIVSRKYVVTALRRCNECALLYRTPTDRPDEAERFYNESYEQGTAMDLPSPAELEVMKAQQFGAMNNDYTKFSEFLRELEVPKGGRLFEYGCSWGYGSWVFTQHGYDVKSYEIARDRREYGVHHLGVNLTNDFERFVNENAGTFDAFFSSHVLEHVPSPSAIIDAALKLLKPGGVLLSVVPNGSDSWRRADPESWRQLWGMVHPNFIDELYLTRALGSVSSIIWAWPASIDDDALAHLNTGAAGTQLLGALDRYELFVAARKPH
ncbi:class I SAM-dependent methyltransferase [Qipengyuania marisflavi]|uniref:Class I SAM-dependent methyltransferase n=1 Tax=Qipengyuania marisflavi TaxID=2486356 RepID=A0A5S3PAU5_9SPHN|nr:class I SAM-dependent methyltransferase [Qipengyuania marisflavi]TMM48168.1 class I SAM-dependent methyltransferase [Qipengyuania marisflavi]